jgi:hypothetical protein
LLGPLDVLRQALQPGDIMLIEGTTRLSAIIESGKPDDG